MDQKLTMIDCGSASLFSPAGGRFAHSHPSLVERSKPSATHYKWLARTSNDVTEEVYMYDNLAVWSKSSLNSTSVEEYKSYSFPDTISWCNWVTFRNDKTNSDDTIDCLSMVLNDKQKIFSVTYTGMTYWTHVSLVFKALWPSKFGIIIEAENTESDNFSLSTVYSISHPCDEAVPVIGCTSSHTAQPCITEFSSSMKGTIISVLCDPSIMVTYDPRNGHQFWLVRYATLNEKRLFEEKEPHMSPVDNAVLNLTRTHELRTRKLNRLLPFSPILKSPFQRKSTSFGSPFEKLQSPVYVQGNKFGQVFHSSPIADRLNNVTTAKPKGAKWAQIELPLNPEICLEFIPCGEPLNGKLSKLANNPASRVFYYKDIYGKTNLCLFVPKSEHVLCYEICYNNDEIKMNKPGSLYCIDALNVDMSPFMVTLEKDSSMFLYSGAQKVCRLWYNDLTSTSERLKHSPFHTIMSLQLSVSNRVIVNMVGKDRLLLAIPVIYNSFCVKLALDVLKRALPTATYCQLICKWYVFRNSIGNRLKQTGEFFAFLECLLLEIGYSSSTEKTERGNDSIGGSKKLKLSDCGQNEDWDQMLASNVGQFFITSTGLYDNTSETKHKDSDSDVIRGFDKIEKSGLLFTHFAKVFYAFHCLYEELKLNTNYYFEVASLCRYLAIISHDLDLEKWTLHYLADFPQKVHLILSERPILLNQRESDQILKNIKPTTIWDVVPSFYKWTSVMFSTHGNLNSFPCVLGLNFRLEKLVYVLLAAYSLPSEWFSNFQKVVTQPTFLQKTSLLDDRFNFGILLKDNVDTDTNSALLSLMGVLGINRNFVETLPFGYAVSLLEIISRGHKNPALNWHRDTIELIERRDLSRQTCELANQRQRKFGTCKDYQTQPNAPNSGVEMDNSVINVLFSEDQRIDNVRKMLISHVPTKIKIQQLSTNEVQVNLSHYARRTMSLPVGRGMYTLCSVSHTVTGLEPIPQLCLSGKLLPKNAVVELAPATLSNAARVWPQFHNGVAAGLRIDRYSNEIENAWIIFNKPKSSTATDSANAHMGFLLGLALNGHLDNLRSFDMHKYLCLSQELTTISLLVGLCASRRGSRDQTLTKTLTLHIRALLPTGGTELEVGHNVQVAALLSAGFLFLQSGDRHMAETMLSEINRPPGPEMDNCVNREAYSLAAGLSLGMILLGKGHDLFGVKGDVSVTTRLYSYVTGGTNQVADNPACYQIREGDRINTCVTAPGATLATGLIFFGSCSQSVAQWFNPPSTSSTVDSLLPEHVMLYTITKSMVFWPHILPSQTWVCKNVPEFLLPLLSYTTADQNTRESPVFTDVSCWQVCVNIIAGSCFSLGLRFAGTSTKEAYDTIFHYLQFFVHLLKHDSNLDGFPGMRSVFTCLQTCLIAISMVMSGTGDAKILAVICHLHNFVGAAYDYGQHMAIHMCLGLLFLGGCRYSLKNDAPSIAALLAAFYPIYPKTSDDNRYHLQAFRHLYTVAVEPRLLITRHSLTDKIVPAKIRITLKATFNYDSFSYEAITPCQIAMLSSISKLECISDDPDYPFLPVSIDVENWTKELTKILVAGNFYVQPIIRQNSELYTAKISEIPFFARKRIDAFQHDVNSFVSQLKTSPLCLSTITIQQLHLVRELLTSTATSDFKGHYWAWIVNVSRRIAMATTENVPADLLCSILQQNNYLPIDKVSMLDCVCLFHFIVISGFSLDANGQHELIAVNSPFDLMRNLRDVLNDDCLSLFMHKIL